MTPKEKAQRLADARAALAKAEAAAAKVAGGSPAMRALAESALKKARKAYEEASK